MGKGRPRSVEKGVLGLGQSSASESSSGGLNVPSGPVYYPTEEEFKEPLEFIYKIRPEAEPYGICRIVPPKSWNPPFVLDLNSFSFPTKTQSIHQLQARPAPCDSKTFELEYSRFLEEQCGRKLKKKIVFEGEELDFCKLFNSVKRYGGYDKVVDEKKWGEVSRFLQPGSKISECAKHVLCQLYREHLYDYETYYSKLHKGKAKNSKSGTNSYRKSEEGSDSSGSKRRRKNIEGERVKTSKVEEEELDQICEQCESGLHGEVMLLCDRCNKGWHIYCLSPPLKEIPPGNWYCLDCLNSDKDSFGFVPGRRFSLEAFRRVADRAKKKWFGSAPTSRVQLEKKFWEIVEGSAGEVDVKYGSDLDTSVYGSGFPRVDDQRPESVDVEKWNEYCASPWNLNNLPKLQGSMLRAVRHGIAGVMVPWLYIGMLFSSFCWHFEDHCFYSMNYLHWGEPKYWYSVPGNKADAFEKVMKNSLPDLFDAQPDLLFQLVTMLNPSVLMENDVPVYSVIQEPGNFVVTFPRSYHGGFNFGLNCAEAVNFAPADWLPHGSFGAELYQLYHKAAVLSHEELLCVVAKNDIDCRTSHYLRKELCRIYDKEKTWRERLWRSGTVSSSPMSPRKHPEYMGSEEDPTCIICQKYVHLSASVCRCRPSTFACLEHSEHLCECKPKKRRLLYRYTLAELKELVQMIDKTDSLKTAQDRNSRRQILSSSEPGALTKKVKGGHLTFIQLAEEWLLNSCKILQNVYSKEAYVKALEEAEQFLWAGAEMDPVREMAKNLTKAKKWAEDVRACLGRLESCASLSSSEPTKVQFKHANSLVKFDPVPCEEPALLRLQKFVEEARALKQEINSALPTCSKISDWEALYSKACALPINIKERRRLLERLSSVKVWEENVKKCLSEKSPAAIEVDTLFSLKAESSGFSIQLPEADMLSDLVRQAEICQDRCNEFLKGSISLEKLETFLVEFSDFTINIPQLKLLRQYHNDAVLWISRYNDVLVKIPEREDQDNVVSELTCIQKDGELLKIQVNELSCIELELKKAYCRAKAVKALTCKMSLGFIQQLVMEATALHIENETWFVNIAGVLTAANNWEERAKHILSNNVQISDFEEAMRTSEDVCAILPSVDAVMDALSSAKSWLEKSRRFILSDLELPSASSCPLKIEELKDLVLQSKLLKISLREQSLLEGVLDNCMKWENAASSILHTATCLLNNNKIQDLLACGLTASIEKPVAELESIIDSGLSLGLDFDDIPKLKDACAILRWCYKGLSTCSDIPQLEEVQALFDARLHLPVTCASSSLFSLVVDGVNWLKKATEITKPCSNRKFKLSDAVDILNQSRNIQLSFKPMVTELVKAIEEHRSWTGKVHDFFSLKRGERSWISLLELQKLGQTCAFNCVELEKVSSEVQKIEKWKHCCKDMLGFSVGDPTSLHQCLLEIGQTIDRSLCIYGASEHCQPSKLCICCSSDVQDSDFVACSVCKDCYHLQCQGHPVVGANSDKLFSCHYCLFVENGKIPQTRGGPLKYKGKRAELTKMTELLSEAEGLALWIEERDVLNQVVQKALSCKELLTEIADSALGCYDEDLSYSAERLSVAVKAVEVAGICFHQGVSKFELAMARNSWRVRANKLLRAPQKPPILQVQRHLKEGMAISLPSEDYFWKKLTEVKLTCMQWAEKAKKVSVDGGALGLDKVFDIISEGENLPVNFEKELKLLRDRSMLYCICRRPYDQRAMIACDECDEWYHFDCIKLHSSPKVYVCPACKLPSEELSSSSTITPDNKSTSHKCEEPQTPSPGRSELSCKLRRPKSSESPVTRDDINDSRRSSGIERLLWRTRKPFRRAVRKRAQLESLSLFLNFQQ